jgi:hypothetical protein
MSYYTAGGKEKPDTTAYLAARKAGRSIGDALRLQGLKG